MYVQGIGKSCTRRHLRETFAVFGEIEETKVFFREDKYVPCSTLVYSSSTYSVRTRQVAVTILTNFLVVVHLWRNRKYFLYNCLYLLMLFCSDDFGFVTFVHEVDAFAAIERKSNSCESARALLVAF